jgi:hypothetical protein
MNALFIVVAIMLNVFLGLRFEAYGAEHALTWAEPVVGLLTTLHLILYFVYPPELSSGRVSRRTLLLCLCLATLGEIFLSAVIGLYTYRQSFLPVFVPPGHVLLFLAGLLIADQKWCGRWIIWVVGIPAASALFYFALHGQDLLSVPLFFLFAACLALGSEKRLYAVMFALALALEICGTWMATWYWHPVSPHLHLSAANPPLAAGAFYACLDLLTVRLRRFRVRSRNPFARI